MFKFAALLWAIPPLAGLGIFFAIVATASPTPSAATPPVEANFGPGLGPPLPAAAPVALPPVSPWAYREMRHALTGRSIRQACVLSTNAIQLERPYESQRLMLCIRRHPERGQDVIIRLPQGGQFVCRYDGCTARVRMGEAAPSSYSLGEPADFDSATLFISNDQRFVRALRGVSEAAIEATYYRAGAQTAIFNVAGLEWDAPATPPASRSKADRARAP